MKKFFFALSVLFLLAAPVAAAAQTVFDQFTDIGREVGLPDFAGGQHEDASTEEGVDSITTAIFMAIDFVKYIIGALAVIFIIVAGIKLIFGGSEIAEEAQKIQDTIKYILIGLLVIITADEVVTRMIFGFNGEFLTSVETAKLFAKQGSELILGITRFIQALLGVVAVFMIVLSGFRMVADPSSEDQVSKATRHIVWSSVGLVIVGISELVVRIFFGASGEEIDRETGVALIGRIAEFIASFLGTTSVLAFIYSGYLYIASFGNDEGIGTAKKVMIYAIVGILIAAAAFAIVSTLISLEGRPEAYYNLLRA